VTDKSTVTIFFSKNSSSLDSITAQLLAKDIESISGKHPIVTTDFEKLKGNVIILGVKNKSVAQKFKDFNDADLQGKKEIFSWQFLNNATPEISKALVITGSDARGLAYGVFKLSEQLGVNPWYWWADVPAIKKETLSIPTLNYLSKTPSVKYRGIFINDEDWGLRPWASQKLDPSLENIGPKTYEKVFELLLRLKANMIWPAMHPGTKAFFSYPANLEVAKKYQIIIGTSHAEPMLRNNVDEWDETKMGRFNYLTNKTKVLQYWESRVKESQNNEVIYSMGMRGVHDSGMEGVKNNKEAVPVLEQVMKDQQIMLSENLGMAQIPQALTLYKEVLDIYDEGLKVPEDITLVWPDDNYGYIRRLNGAKEDHRKGGSGVYYHASYWGRPHDYLWLSTTPPPLMREEMVKAYNFNAKDIWVLNVGDIKPAEYQTQLFMDMAFDITPFQQNDYLKKHLENWYQDIFKDKGKEIASIIWQYNQLAFERKPEFMGWSQTEPTTSTQLTAYNHFSYGDEAQQRIDSYSKLENQTKLLNEKLPQQLKSSFYELVYYPVVGAAQMNKKFLYHDKAVLYNQQGRLSAKDYQDSVHHAYKQIIQLTKYYNNSLANGKWEGMMSMAPRKLPVFDEPATVLSLNKSEDTWAISPEGYTEKNESKDLLSLPNLYVGDAQSYFIDLFLLQEKVLNFQIIADKKGILFSQDKGVLSPKGELQKRIRVSLDPHFLTSETVNFLITIKTNLGDKYLKGTIIPHPSIAINKDVFLERNGYISIFAENYSAITKSNNQHWELMDGLGYSGKVMSSTYPDKEIPERRDSAILSYNFLTTNTHKPTLHVYTIPTHPLNTTYGLKYAVRIDDGKWQIKDFTTVGRSKEWKENVLSNNAEQVITFEELKPGLHKLDILAIDPMVMIDRFVIDMGDLKPAYSLLKETK
jgi:hypothetical protein